MTRLINILDATVRFAGRRPRMPPLLAAVAVCVVLAPSLALADGEPLAPEEWTCFVLAVVRIALLLLGLPPIHCPC